METRVAGYLDADSIMEIDEAARTDRLHRNFIHQAVTSRNCHVALIDRGIAGYAILDYSFFGNGFIAMLFVAPERRRQGVGEGLLRHLEKVCKKKRLFTKMLESNAPFRALLEKLDYSPSGTIQNLKDGTECLYFIRPRRPEAEDD